jgi:TatD DNase family protein
MSSSSQAGSSESAGAGGGAATRPVAPNVEPVDPPVFDAHCHLDAMAHRAGRAADARFVEEVMTAARAVGITRVITVGDTVAASRWCVKAANAHPDVYAAVAVHPTEVSGLADAGYAELAELAADPRVVAVGETGLDYYWDRTAPAEQHDHFRRHIDLAKGVGKPVMIHDRQAHDDVLRILAEEGPPTAGTIFHAFSGDVAMARTCVAAGYVLSFAGVVTFTNAADLRAAAAVTPLDSILVETDAPFLTPHPYRGRPNSPAFVPLTLHKVAQVTSNTPSALAAGIAATGRRLFRWA